MKACATLTPTPIDFNNLPEKHNYLRIHKTLYGKPGVGRVLPLSAITIGGLVYAYSARGDATCVRTYSRINKDLCISQSTISRAFSKLKATFITSDKQSSYTFNPVERIEYNRSEELFYNEYFNVRGVVRRLKQSEIHVASSIVTKCLNNKKKANACTFSMRELAEELNFNLKTVKTAIKNLLYACIIVRAAEEKGNCKAKKSTYHLNRKLYLHIKRGLRKASEKAVQPSETIIIHKNADDVATEARANRERFYFARREIAERRAESNKAKALKDAVFAAAEKEINTLGRLIAFAEIRNPNDVAELQKRMTNNLTLRAEALKRLNLSEDDLTPKYHCTRCSDSGTLPNGRLCDCYERSKQVN